MIHIKEYFIYKKTCRTVQKNTLKNKREKYTEKQKNLESGRRKLRVKGGRKQNVLEGSEANYEFNWKLSGNRSA